MCNGYRYINDLLVNYTLEVVPSIYVYCIVRYCVTAAPYVGSVGCVFAHLYILVDDLEHHWTELSLRPKVVSFRCMVTKDSVIV